MMTRTLAVATAALTTLLAATSVAQAQRAIGIDVSYWQGDSINWSQVRNQGKIDFAFIRASRGGTTGYSDSSGFGYGSRRYDDPYLDLNMNGARQAGIFAGAYHFARPDVMIGWSDSRGVAYDNTNTGLDEANHFIEEAGAYMRAGYIRPVLDLEVGASRGRTGLTDFALEFSDRIYEATGVRPIIYANSNYASSYFDSRLQSHDLWLARYLYNSYTPADAAAAVQVDNPPSDAFGIFKTTAEPQPWDIWQYSAQGRTPGIGNGAVNVDQNVANGGIEKIKDLLVPAIWQTDAGGSWSAPANWNGDKTTYVPTANERVIISRANVTPTITVSTGAQRARSLQADALLNVTGGSLTIEQYAQLSQHARVSGGSLSAASISTAYLTISGTGVVNVAGAITGAGNSNVTVTGGTLSAGSIATSSPLEISGTGRVTLTGSGGSRVQSLSVTGGGSLELGLADLVVNYSGTSPLASIRAAIAANSIGSNRENASLGVGVIEATRAFASFSSGTTWNGVAVDSTSLLMSLALFGDTDLNGTVNLADLTALSASWNAAGTWQNGDATGDGVVSRADLDLLGLNYGKTLLADGTITGGNPAAFAAALAGFPVLVPEPTTLTATLALAAAALGRRRRN